MFASPGIFYKSELNYGNPTKGLSYKIQKGVENNSNEIKIKLPFGPDFDLIKNLAVKLYINNISTPLLNPKINAFLEIGGEKSNPFDYNKIWFQENILPITALYNHHLFVLVDVSEYVNSNPIVEVCFDNYVLTPELKNTVNKTGFYVYFNNQTLVVNAGMGGWKSGGYGRPKSKKIYEVKE